MQAKKNHKNLAYKLYAQGRNIVDPDAITRMQQVEEDKKPYKEETKQNSKAQNRTSNNATKSSPLNASALALAVRQFDKLLDHYKSIAIAGIGDNVVSGMASKELTQFMANKRALAGCEHARLEYAIEAHCVLRVIGKSRVSDNSVDAIAKITAWQQKRNAKNSVLQASYKKYRKFSTDKAYVYSTDTDGNWVSGIAFCKRGTAKATAAALAECDKSRLKKSIRTSVPNSNYKQHVCRTFRMIQVGQNPACKYDCIEQIVRTAIQCTTNTKDNTYEEQTSKASIHDRCLRNSFSHISEHD